VCSILKLLLWILFANCGPWYNFCTLSVISESKQTHVVLRLNKCGLFRNKHNGMALLIGGGGGGCVGGSSSSYKCLEYQMTEYLWKNAMSLWTTEVKNDFLLHQFVNPLLLIYITHWKCCVKNTENPPPPSTNSRNTELYMVTVSVVEKSINNLCYTHFPYIFLIYFAK
jgi:hypothetical protein